ncbi:hypothetical protein ACL_0816 [Acholeplasma laidlawii PG-8A]|uniref:Uncharacterized protein n=1 Tax=Acholeplasma laidlawii (strain PG-8A) TaxID=441768 RepID=A9NGF0_ACHLI|nr:hypothetical protein ACL_0816 [Acholeplasma laidlawii PG-8A]
MTGPSLTISLLVIDLESLTPSFSRNSISSIEAYALHTTTGPKASPVPTSSEPIAA